MRDLAYDAGRQGGLSLWGGVLEGEVAEVLEVLEVGVAGQIADAAVEVESELDGEGSGVGVLMNEQELNRL